MKKDVTELKKCCGDPANPSMASAQQAAFIEV